MKRTIPLFLLLLFIPAFAMAVSFEITDYAMDIRVSRDGAGYFTERLDYTFSGEHNGFTATLRHGDGAGISELRLFVDDAELSLVETLDGIPGTFTAVSEDEQTSLRAYAPGGSGTRTFRIEYRMGGFARRYLDTARIDRTLLRAEVPYGRAVFTLSLPGDDPSQVQAFTHGALQESDLHIEGERIRLGPLSISENEQAGITLLFPEAWLSQAHTISSSVLEETLQREQELISLAAMAEEEAQALARLMQTILLAALAVYAIGFSLVLLNLKNRYGFRHRPASALDESLLNDTPAAIAQLLYKKDVTASGLCATLMELAGLGVLSMAGEQGDTRFPYLSMRDGLLEHQSQLVQWLFPWQQTLFIRNLDAGDDDREALAFTTSYNSWKACVVKDAHDAGLVYRNGGAKFLLALSSLVLGVFFALTLFETHALLSIAALVLGVCFCCMFSSLRRLSDEGERRVAAINGFVDSYEDRFSQNPMPVIKRAPLLMALGYMEPMAEWIDSHPTSGDDDAATLAWYYAGWHHQMVRMERDVREAQSHNARVNDPASVGGSGGDGGAAGGSSGGSSHGAW